jgi:CRISPR system Cascade subunit CasA
MADFDLLTEPWIPAVTVDGKRVEVSLLDAFRAAPLLHRIVDSSPLVTFALHRLLAAVLHRYGRLGADEPGAWAGLWEAGHFPEELLATIAARCAGRMRLFDADRPFYQSADIVLPERCDRDSLGGKSSERPAEPLKSIGYVTPDAPTGTNATHFNHAGEVHHAFCPACCARGLVMLPCFATAGGAGLKPGINGVPPLYVLPRGETLFRTLMLNWLLPSLRDEPPGDEERCDPGPLWDGDGVIAGGAERATTGFVESLTWPPRRVRLLPEGRGVCSRCGRAAETLTRRMVFGQGWSRSRSLPPWRDAWVAYAARPGRGQERAEWIPVRPTDRPDAWRNISRLFLRSAHARRPAVVDHIDGLVQEGLLQQAAGMTYDTFGLRTDMKSKIFEWWDDSFTVPNALLASPAAAETVGEGLSYADHAAVALKSALRELHARLADARDPWTGLTLRSYWTGLGSAFRAMLLDPRLPGDPRAQDEWLRGWRQAVGDLARGQLDRALAEADAGAGALRRQALARGAFRIQWPMGGNEA